MLVLRASSSRLAAIEAAHSAFSEVEIVEFNSLSEAAATAPVGFAELLVIDSTSPGYSAAIGVCTLLGELRWAVVVLGGASLPPALVVPPEEWSADLLAHLFRQSLEQFELRRENLGLRGDLTTIARRISHDLRSPVGCMHTGADVLRELSACDEETMRSVAAMVKESAGEVAQIVDRISFVLLATAEKTKPVPVDMGEIVAEVLQRLRPCIQKMGSSIATPLAWPNVLGVPSWLSVVWGNLVENALQHAGPRPVIWIDAAPVVDGILFSVADNGAGVAPPRVSSLFTRFDRLHSLSVRGLGLSIVQRLVELQGGRCGYEKGPEGRAKFYFTLPAAVAE